MYRYKRKKGYISIYTIIIMTLIMEMSFSIFKLYIMTNKYNDKLIKIELNDENNQRIEKILLSKVGKYAKENIKNSDKLYDGTSCNIFNKIGDKKISYKESFVKYDKENDNIILFLKIKENLYKKEYYKYYLDSKKDNKVVFHFLKSKY